MSFVGKSVYTIWGDHNLRFGVVVEERMIDNWKHVRVNWRDDEAFEMDRERVLHLRNLELNHKFNWYRCDKVNVFNPINLGLTLSKLL